MPKNHKYVNFTDRVAGIRIDPIRRSSQKRNAPDAANSDSLFCSSLERWNELNLATKFTEFSHSVSKIAQSLPMVLYNQRQIFEMLEMSLKNTDIHSADAFFDLLVNFARDLGEDFEPFYAQSLEACIYVIGKFQRDDESLEIIEYAFNCLAHLFKYLARLLTANLGPTYDLLLPLFGGDKSFKPRGFVLRFAAESMAFLVRRASGENLELIVDHIVGKLGDERENEQLLESTASLLATTLKGPGITLHSKTPTLLKVYFDSCHKFSLVKLFDKVVVDALHHARQDTAQPLYTEVLERCRHWNGNFSCRILFTVAGLRKGDRVSDWQAMFETLFALDASVPSWTEAASAIICFADMKSAATNIKRLLELAPSERATFRILESVSQMAPSVFTAFTSSFWPAAYTHHGENLELLSLLKLDLGAADVPRKLADRVKFSDISFKEMSSRALFDIWWKSIVGIDLSESKRIQLLKSVLNMDLQDNVPLNTFRSNVVAEFMTESHSNADLLLASIEKLLLTPKLLDRIASFLKAGLLEPPAVLSALAQNLQHCLMSCDMRIRSSAIELVKLLVNDPNFLLDQCATINSLPLDLANARNIALRLRGLAAKYKHSGADSVEASNAAVYFFFGMLTARLQPVTAAVLECIPALAEKGPDLVCDVAYMFIAKPESTIGGDLFISWSYEAMDSEASPARDNVTLNCHTLSTFDELNRRVWEESNHGIMALQRRASESLKFDHYDDLRQLGINALSQIPRIAERTVVPSLIPYLLQAKDEDEDNEIFGFKDRVALLGLFAKLSKPEKLPRFDEIKLQYLYFLCSRHSPLQTLSMKCLYTINQREFSTLRKYRENFDALLDDKRFRDELTSFVSTGKDEIKEGSLHPDDRLVVLPFVVRILYGRAQNSTKRNMRHAVLSSLHFLEPQYLESFVNIAQDHLLESLSGDEKDVIRRVQGYLTLMNDLVHQLKTAAERIIPIVIQRGYFTIIDGQWPESKAIRHLLNKSLDEMISSAPKYEIWAPFESHLMDKLIRPQLGGDFAVKNLENASAFMKMIQSVSSESQLIPLLNWEILSALVSTLTYDTVKDSVIQCVLQTVLNLAVHTPNADLTRLAVSEVVQHLSMQMDNDLSPESFGLATELVIKIFDLKVNELDSEIVHNLAHTSLKALSKPSKSVPLPVKARVMFALSQIFAIASNDLLETAYVSLSPLFRQFVARDARVNLSACYKVFGQRIPRLARVGRLIVELNSFDEERLGEPDFARRSTAFEEINEQLWPELTAEEWRPLMFNCLFYLRDPEELALRNNGKFTIMRLIESQTAPDLVMEYVLPAVKRGLRDSDDKFRRLYIDILAQCAHSNALPTLDVLLYRGDEEADFFININHVQVHRRRRAVQRLGKHASELDSSVIAHYLLSIVESLAMHSGSKNPELNNLADDALHAITELLHHVSPGQFKSVARRWVQQLAQEPEPAKLRKNVRIVTAVAQATPAGLDDYVLNVLVAPLHKVLSSKSNEHENLPDRVPIAVAIVYFLKSLEPANLEKALPGKLTSLCQMLRSKVPELRDSVRQSLSKIMRILGSKYLKFVILELTGSLRRGGMQSHVLGYTVHSILAELSRLHDVALSIGDTDDSAGLIFKVVMDDTFGSIGEEKDSEGYVTAAKEVKQHKSFDTAEILAVWTSLSQFGQIIAPMRQFLSSKKLNSKVEHKVEEVLRRLAAGLHRNPQANTQDAVIMGYEIYRLCEKLLTEREAVQTKQQQQATMSGALAARIQAAKESEEYFTVRLSSRDWYESGDAWTKEANATRYAVANMHLLQTFAVDILRSVMTSTAAGAVSNSGKGLLNIANVKGLLPIIMDGFSSTSEDLNLATLRLATMALRLPIEFADDDDTLVRTADRSLYFIENSLDTNTLLCQAALKYLTMLVRSKPEFELKAGAVAYVLERIKPDLEEPERQSTAISFVRAIFSRKVMLPQVYDIADMIAKVLVTNYSEHIRVNCQNAYVQFLTTYPLGVTRLNRHLTELAANLRYAAASGRLSVMETLHLLLVKTDVAQLEATFVQFYTNLVLVLVSDTEPECRRRAKDLLKELLSAKVSSAVHEQMVDLCKKWLGSLGKNDLLVRGGIEVATLLKDDNKGLEAQLLATAQEILRAGQKTSDQAIDWQLLYLALDIDSPLLVDEVDKVLLFPHPWVRARAARYFGSYFKNTPKKEIPEDLLVSVGQKLVRQLGAPRLDDSLQIVKDLVFIIPLWSNAEIKERSATEWLVHKLVSMIRTDVSAEDHVGGKTGAIQVLASLPSLVSPETLRAVAYEIILGLYILTDQLASENRLPDLQSLAQEAMGIYDETLGTTEYFKIYTSAKQYVDDRRRERRAKRSIEAVSMPELAAQKRIKRNSHKRDVRKLKNNRSVR